MSSPLYYAAVCCLSALLVFDVNGGRVKDDDPESAIRRLENGILDLVESSIRYYLQNSDVVVHTAAVVDVNLMLGVSIMKGQFKSCAANHRSGYNYYGNNNSGFDRTDRLTKMIDALYSTFYKNNNSTDIEIIKKILDDELWTSTEKISHITPRDAHLSRGFDVSSLANGDHSYFRNVSDKCIRQVISTSQMSGECVGPELTDEFSGYSLTHQLLYMHIFKQTNRKNPVFRKVIEKIVRDKCSKIYNEAVHIADDLNTLDKYRDLFLEQIVVCGMENMVEFVKPEWLSIVFSKNHFDCFKHRNNPYCHDSHLTGVSLAALGVYWKFLCYKVNTIYVERDIDFQNTI